MKPASIEQTRITQAGLKRALDIFVAAGGLLILAPLLALIALLVWLEDRHSPWYRGERVARETSQGGGLFRMLKFRSMRVDAWKAGVNSTSVLDPRITRCGRLLRRLKLDELPQLWNVLTGEMSLVGPRPQVPADAALYTKAEKRMLLVRPGITDLASIVFADEGEILSGSADPDLLYHQIIRPWKSRLALLYAGRASLAVDLRILGLTALALVSRTKALTGVNALLQNWEADRLLRQMALRQVDLEAHPPPGASHVVGRNGAVWLTKPVDGNKQKIKSTAGAPTA